MGLMQQWMFKDKSKLIFLKWTLYVINNKSTIEITLKNYISICHTSGDEWETEKDQKNFSLIYIPSTGTWGMGIMLFKMRTFKMGWFKSGSCREDILKILNKFTFVYFSPYHFTYRQLGWLGTTLGDLEQENKKKIIIFLHKLEHFKTVSTHPWVFEVTKFGSNSLTVHPIRKKC